MDVKMKAAYLEAPYKMGIREIEQPAVAEDEVLIKVKCTGICGSDLHAFRGVHAFRKPPVILGHELSGEIVKVGSRAEGFALGDRVTVMPQIGCGQCRYCKMDKANICLASKMPGVGGWLGSFVEYFNAPAKVVLKLPDNVSYDQGALAEPLAVAVHALKRIAPYNRDRLVILGSGTIGLMMISIAKLLGFGKILATDALDFNLNMAQSFGADRTVNVTKENLSVAVRDTFGEDKADAVIVAASAPDILDQAIESIHPSGEIIYLAMITKPMTVNSYPIVFDEMTLKGSRNYTISDFAEAVNLLASGKVDFQKFITQRYTLETAQAGMELLDKKTADSVKVMLYI